MPLFHEHHSGAREQNEHEHDAGIAQRRNHGDRNGGETNLIPDLGRVDHEPGGKAAQIECRIYTPNSENSRRKRQSVLIIPGLQLDRGRTGMIRPFFISRSPYLYYMYTIYFVCIYSTATLFLSRNIARLTKKILFRIVSEQCMKKPS